MIRQRTLSHPTVRRLFEGRKIVVASMHGKHYAMKPLIRQYLAIDTVVVPDFDTDAFGAFSGEIERPFDTITTLRKKIIKGLQTAGETLGIGSEGSFGPHPNVPFIQANQEVVMLIDLEHDLEVMEYVVTTETNHAATEISSLNDLTAFAEQVQFPSHGIILKQDRKGKVINMCKGIVSWEQLQAMYFQFVSSGTKVIAETDMRGYFNPTRMKAIERATSLLMKRVISLCPECQWPGFGVIGVEPGLPCEQCGQPTGLPLLKLYQCKHCLHSSERYCSEGNGADTQYCEQCNP